jgi:hypothetical protein
LQNALGIVETDRPLARSAQRKVVLFNPFRRKAVLPFTSLV